MACRSRTDAVGSRGCLGLYCSLASDVEPASGDAVQNRAQRLPTRQYGASQPKLFRGSDSRRPGSAVLHCISGLEIDSDHAASGLDSAVFSHLAATARQKFQACVVSADLCWLFCAADDAW